MNLFVTLGWSQRVKWALLSVFGGKIILNVQSHLFALSPFLLRISLCLPGCWSWANFCFTVGATLTTWEVFTTGVSHRLWLYLLWAVSWWSRGRQIGYWLILVVRVWFHWGYSIIFLVKAVDANKQKNCETIMNQYQRQSVTTRVITNRSDINMYDVYLGALSIS